MRVQGRHNLGHNLARGKQQTSGSEKVNNRKRELKRN
jgi:hypothetical protein